MPALNIDPSKPSPEEIAAHQYKVSAHNMKVAKANLASTLCERLCSNPGLADIIRADATFVSKTAVAISEDIMETYSLMPDAAGNKGGLVS